MKPCPICRNPFIKRFDGQRICPRCLTQKKLESRVRTDLEAVEALRAELQAPGRPPIVNMPPRPDR